MPSIVFDVDGTLIHKTGEETDTPRYDVISLYHFFEKIGYEMYIWSGSGKDYAENWKRKLGLFSATVMEKTPHNAEHVFFPDLTVDDKDVVLGMLNIKV